MKRVEIHALPSSLVALLEEKNKLKGRLGPKGTEIWRDLMPSLLRMHFNLRVSASHEDLEKIGLELADTLDFLQKNILIPESHKEFTAHCFRAYALMDRYLKVRTKLNTSRVPAVDRLIHAIQAHLRNNLHVQALDAYAGEAKQAVDKLVELFKQVAPNLDEPAKKGLLMGIDSFTQAYKELKDKEPQSLKNAVVNLRNGAVLLEHLAVWKEEIEAETRSPVPVVGDDVTMMLNQLAQQGHIEQNRLLDWVENRFWDLQENWAKARHDMFMPREQKDLIVGRLDQLMLSLKDLDQHAPRVQEQLLHNLIAQYDALSTCGFRVEELKEHPSPWLVDLIVAILAKGVPKYKILETIEDFKDSDYHVYAVLLQKYLDEGDRDYLLDALSEIERECLDRVELPS